MDLIPFTVTATILLGRRQTLMINERGHEDLSQLEGFSFLWVMQTLIQQNVIQDARKAKEKENDLHISYILITSGYFRSN